MVLNCSLFFKAKNVIPDLSRRYCTHCTVLAIITKIKNQCFTPAGDIRNCSKHEILFLRLPRDTVLSIVTKILNRMLLFFFSFLKMLRTSQTQFIARQDKFSEAKFAKYPKNWLYEQINTVAWDYKQLELTCTLCQN